LVLLTAFLLTNFVISSECAENCYYGEHIVSSPVLHSYGITYNPPFFDFDNSSINLSLSIEYSKETEKRKRDIFDNYGNYCGKNVYAEHSHTDFDLNHFGFRYKNFIFAYDREYECNAEFSENIYDLAGNILKSNNRSSDGGLNSYNLYYTPHFIKTRKLKLFAAASFNKFKNSVAFSENFSSPAFADYSRSADYDGNGYGWKLAANYALTERFEFIGYYKSRVKYEGDYSAADNIGNSVVKSDARIVFPQELAFTCAVLMPSEHFTRLFLNIHFTDWKNLRDDYSFTTAIEHPRLKRTFLYSLGLKYRVSTAANAGVAVSYEPQYFAENSKKIGLNLGLSYTLTDRINANTDISVDYYLYKEKYPFDLQASGLRISRVDSDYSYNTSVKLKFGIEYKF